MDIQVMTDLVGIVISDSVGDKICSSSVLRSAESCRSVDLVETEFRRLARGKRKPTEDKKLLILPGGVTEPQSSGESSRLGFVCWLPDLRGARESYLPLRR